MNPFQYIRPKTIQETLSLLDEYGPQTCLLAGGTDVVVRMRKRGMAPGLVIDLKRVNELRRDVTTSGGFLRFGALAVMTDIIEDPQVRRNFPALVEAASVVGSVQIRNRATLAGNICNASPAADTAPALLVYEALVNIAGLKGARTLPLCEFFLGPGKTALASAEIVTSIDLPFQKERDGAAFGRLTRRHGVDLASINLCCRVKAGGETLFAFGAVAPRPLLFSDPSGCLADPHADQPQKDRVIQAMIAETSPISDVRASREYRLAMLAVLSRRALQTALERLHQPDLEMKLYANP